jgi:hypothetical protein
MESLLNRSVYLRDLLFKLLDLRLLFLEQGSGVVQSSDSYGRATLDAVNEKETKVGIGYGFLCQRETATAAFRASRGHVPSCQLLNFNKWRFSIGVHHEADSMNSIVSVFVTLSRGDDFIVAGSQAPAPFIP